MNQMVTLWLASRALAEARRDAAAREGERPERAASTAARRSRSARGLAWIPGWLTSPFSLVRRARPAGAGNGGSDPCTCQACTCQP